MTIETPEYAAMLRRMIRRYGERVGDDDPIDLTEMLAVRDAFDAAIAEAVAGQRERGYSWREIGEALGITREAAWQRFHLATPRGKRVAKSA